MIRARPVTFAGGASPRARRRSGRAKRVWRDTVDQNRNERKRAIKSEAVEGCVSYEEAFKRFANQFATACPRSDKY